MKRLIIILVVILFIYGCKDDEPNVVVSTELPPVERPDSSNEAKEVKIPSPYVARSEEFDRVIGWISETEIMFLENNMEGSHVYTYDLNSNKKTHHATVEMPINDVIIHPSKSHFTLLMSENSLQAIIGIYEMGGTKVDELTIESSEIVFEWHPSQVELMTVTAFYEDWTFDSFVYSSNTKEMKRLETNDPFGKWGKESSIYTINWPENDTLSGGSLREINTVDMTSKDSDSNIIYVEAADGVEVRVSISNDQQKFLYTLVRYQDGKSTKFELPAISNYSQWFVPDIEWLRDGTMLTYESSKAGLMDEIPSEFDLIQLSIDKPKNTILEGPYESFACNPSGRICLTGVQLEKLLEVESGEIHSWITLGE